MLGIVLCFVILTGCYFWSSRYIALLFYCRVGIFGGFECKVIFTEVSSLYIEGGGEVCLYRILTGAVHKHM